MKRSLITILFVALTCATSLGLSSPQTKAAPAPAKQAALKPLDINTASEAEMVDVGIDKAAAKKIVENRPYRNKTELVSKMLLTRDQYDKVKDSIIAKQPPKATSK